MSLLNLEIPCDICGLRADSLGGVFLEVLEEGDILNEVLHFDLCYQCREEMVAGMIRDIVRKGHLDESDHHT